MRKKINAYLKDHIGDIFVSACFIFLVYGTKLASFAISIDNEAAISIRDDFYWGWLSVGRFGLVALKKLMGQAVFNPSFSMSLLVLGMIVSAALWGMDCRRRGQRGQDG